MGRGHGGDGGEENLHSLIDMGKGVRLSHLVDMGKEVRLSCLIYTGKEVWVSLLSGKNGPWSRTFIV